MAVDSDAGSHAGFAGRVEYLFGLLFRPFHSHVPLISR
jgi:hypothetical protein